MHAQRTISHIRIVWSSLIIKKRYLFQFGVSRVSIFEEKQESLSEEAYEEIKFVKLWCETKASNDITKWAKGKVLLAGYELDKPGSIPYREALLVSHNQPNSKAPFVVNFTSPYPCVPTRCWESFQLRNRFSSWNFAHFELVLRNCLHAPQKNTAGERREEFDVMEWDRKKNKEKNNENQNKFSFFQANRKSFNLETVLNIQSRGVDWSNTNNGDHPPCESRLTRLGEKHKKFSAQIVRY